MPRPALLPALALAALLCPGCVVLRSGQPFDFTVYAGELSQDGTPLRCVGACSMVSCAPALDLFALPGDLAIQAFAPARIRVVDEAGSPVEGADVTVGIECMQPNPVVLRRRTGRDGSFRLRRRVFSKQNPWGARVLCARIAKDGYCPVRAGDFSAFAKSNVVTVTMPHFVPGAGHAVEYAEDDPAGRFPPWRDTGSQRVYIDCRKGRYVPWESGPGDPGNGDLELFVWDRRENRADFVVRAPRWWTTGDGVAVVPADAAAPGMVPAGTDFKMSRTISSADFSDDEPRKAVLFAVRRASAEDPPHYGRIDFWWKDGYPVGIRRVLYSDAPGERSLHFTAPPPIPVADESRAEGAKPELRAEPGPAA